MIELIIYDRFIQLKIEDQQCELEYLKEVNKKLINQILQSRMDL